MNLIKIIAGGVLTIAGIFESIKALTSSSDLLYNIIIIGLTVGAGYIFYQGIKD